MSDGERRDNPVSGRREYDPPGVPLREHLETLIRGVQIRFEHDTAELARAIREGNDHCRDQFEELGKSLHKLKGDVQGLRQLNARRQGELDAKKRLGEWARWIPAVVSVLLAAYVAFS